jgi:hypothetical protein
MVKSKLTPKIKHPATWTMALSLAILGMIAMLGVGEAMAQNPTPLPIIIPTRTATLETLQATSTQMPTSTGSASAGRVEAKISANVRAAPNLDSEILGKITPGQFFAITGRSDKWIQIEYDKAPTGRAWVFEDVVNVTGINLGAIPTIGRGDVPTANVATAAAQQTADILVLTPGAPETATVQKASATGVFTRVAEDSTAGPTSDGPKPTFTFPPAHVEATLPPRRSPETSQGGVPPIVPIIVLGGIGVCGLLISTLRRL